MKIEFSKKAEKQLSNINQFIKNKILRTIDKFERGERIDIKKMKGNADEFRIRVGDYRILLKKFDNNFLITKIGKRENIYFLEF